MEKPWDLEKRVPFDASTVEQTSEDEGVFTGRAAVFGNVDYDNEIIQKGAFSESIEANGNTFTLLDSHKVDTPIGFVRVSEDDRGLNVDEGHINLSHHAGAAVFSHLKFSSDRGASVYNGMSIGGMVTKDTYGKGGIRMVEGIDLMEVSIVTFPANPQTHFSSLKSAAKKLEVKHGLRDEGSLERLEVFFKKHRRAKQQFGRFIIDDEPVIDVCDDRLVLVPEAVYRVTAKHFVACFTEESSDHRATLTECYRLMDRSPPWTPEDFEDLRMHLKDLTPPEKEGEQNYDIASNAVSIIDSWTSGENNEFELTEERVKDAIERGWNFIKE